MAFIKVDRNQTKAVAALLAVLAVVLGVIVYRMRSTPAVHADAQQRQSTSGAMQSVQFDPSPGKSDRNPFKKPRAILSAYNDPPQASPGDPAADVPTDVPPMPVDGPLLVTSEGEAGAGQSSGPGSAIEDQSQPTFTLMTTIVSSGKSCAVLRIGDSQVKVVSVGDMVDGRFRLKSVEPDCAELTDGVVTVTAKRGRVEDAEPTG